MLLLWFTGVGKKDKSYEKDIQELQQQQATIMQTQQQQQQTPGQQQPPVGQEQNNSSPQQQNIYQQPGGQQQQQQINATSVPGPAAHGTNPEVNTEHVKELQEVQMELLNKIMRKQAKEKDPEVLQRLFNEQNILLQQMSQLQTAGYAYSQPLPAPAAPPVVQPQPVPMET